MNEIVQQLRRPEYVHVLLNHFPIVGLAVALMALGIGAISKNSTAIIGSLLPVALTAISVWPVIESGESAFNSIRSISDPDGVTALKRHMLLADRWSLLYYVTAAAAALGALLVWRRPKSARLAVAVVILLGVASLVAGVNIAKLGGQVRHPEFRFRPSSGQQTSKNLPGAVERAEVTGNARQKVALAGLE
jgi:hypothetical protein